MPSDMRLKPVRDSLLWVDGRCSVYQGRRQVVVSKLQLLREDELDLKDYIPEGTLDADVLYEKLLGYVASMQDPFYKALAEAVLIEDAEIVDRIKRAPAAKSMHHAYKAGLIEHVVSITGILESLAAHYGKIVDRI
ncbi:unnamed protein product [Sphagnum jensenii]|uniref:Uncharacterized protein n=1 Tax=Sphagnum jensenii TaxID=128206 RepID=A0ABP0V6V0_9BRYO